MRSGRVKAGRIAGCTTDLTRELRSYLATDSQVLKRADKVDTGVGRFGFGGGPLPGWTGIWPGRLKGMAPREEGGPKKSIGQVITEHGRKQILEHGTRGERMGEGGGGSLLKAAGVVLGPALGVAQGFVGMLEGVEDGGVGAGVLVGMGPLGEPMVRRADFGAGGSLRKSEYVVETVSLRGSPGVHRARSRAQTSSRAVGRGDRFDERG